LKESKDFIETLERELRRKDPGKFAASTAGECCLGAPELLPMRALKTPDDIAKAYLRYYHSEFTAEKWASDAVGDMLTTPEAGVVICIALANACDANNELSFVAAGPYENLLRGFGPAVLPSLMKAAETSEKVRVALSGVWLRADDPVYPAWQQAMVQYGFWSHRPMSPLDRGWEPKDNKDECNP